MKTTVIKTTMMAAVILAITALSVNAQDAAAPAAPKPKGAAWNAPADAAAVKNPVKADENSLREGKELYGTHCKSCHGIKGKGDGPKTENIDIACGDFTTADFAKESDGSVFWKCTEGRKPMPSFKEKLSDNERWTVIAYIRSLAEKK